MPHFNFKIPIPSLNTTYYLQVILDGNQFNGLDEVKAVTKKVSGQ